MPLAIFDLDETLVRGDCSTRFCEFIERAGLIDAPGFVEAERAMMDNYRHQRLSMDAYIAFILAPLSTMSTDQIAALMPAFIDRCISDHIYPQALALLNAHHRRGDRILIISASADFIVDAVAESLAVEDVLAINLERTAQGCYSGLIQGVPSYREGKVIRLHAWLQQQDETLAGACFYSDSINDQPLLELVDYPVATNPDRCLAELANRRGWPVLDWRHQYGAEPVATDFNFILPKTGS
ncbi:MAG: HAD superfamily hydrolase (TIGR01490 family) [Motiliproteus sp.]|jgi:HAD superfamily hydrolase (TIGR01490 family)